MYSHYRMAHRASFSLIVCSLMLGLATGFPSSASAQTEFSDVQFYFTNPGQTTPLTSLLVNPGDAFTLRVWYSSASFVHDTLEVFIGFDETTETGLDVTPLNNQLTAADANAAITNRNTTDFAFVDAAFAGAEGTGTRPYGIDVVATVEPFGSTRTGSAPTALFDITLTSSGLLPGQSTSVLIYNAGNGVTGFSSFLSGFDGEEFAYARDNTYTLTVTAAGLSVAPEPATLALLLGSLFPFVLRQQKQR